MSADYETRVRALEAEGLTRSDAQGVVDAEDMKAKRASAVPVCEVCGVELSGLRDRCTNGRCGRCHARHCTPGGQTSPGHGRGTVPTPFARAKVSGAPR